jgi:hypothetical protein
MLTGFILFLVLGLVLIVLSALLMPSNMPLRGDAIGALFTGALYLFMAGLFSIKHNDSYLVIDRIIQNDIGYVIYTDEFKIYQKECHYKVGDTLWIKK